MSQPDRHQVIALRRIPKKEEGLTEPEAEANWRPVVGTGERCLPGDADRCGDGGSATKARLAYPKGESSKESPTAIPTVVLRTLFARPSRFFFPLPLAISPGNVFEKEMRLIAFFINLFECLDRGRRREAKVVTFHRTLFWRSQGRLPKIMNLD